jgi:hypothetical protein
MTAAPHAVSLLDDGVALSPADRAALAVFDRHSEWEATRLELRLAELDGDRCLVCGVRMPDGDTSSECDHCHAGHDFAVARSADL